MPEHDLTLEALGWNGSLQSSLTAEYPHLDPGRVAVEDKHHYVVLSQHGEFLGQITGRLMHCTPSAAELPKVGDWVAFSRVAGEPKALIHGVLPRRTRLSRKAAGREIEEQVLVTNVDVAFVVQALDRTFNPALLQRHLIMVMESGAKPVVVLNKADLCREIAEKVALVKEVAPDTARVVVSAKTAEGIEELNAWIQPGETVVFIGSSGVGKSTLINDLVGEEVQATSDVRERDAKGRHTTTWREMIILPNGGLVVDTPGMREFQMWVADEGMREAFADLEALATQCHFRNCSHTVEKRCAVLESLSSGQVPQERYQKFVKLTKELAYLQEAQTQQGWMQRKRQSRVAQRAFTRPRRNQGS